MGRPWKIWLLFGLCLAIILPAMVWLTIKAIQLEESRRVVLRENEEARREAELQELVSSALWRMDWMLTPLVGQEASRSHLDYRTLAAPTSKAFDLSDPETWKQSVSPIVTQPSEFVKLHFQVDENDAWSSPQNLPSNAREAAISNGLLATSLDENRDRMQQLADSLSNPRLVKLLPEQQLPEDLLAGVADSQSAYPNQLNWLANAGTLPQRETNVFLPNNLEEQVEIYENNTPQQSDEQLIAQAPAQNGGEFNRYANAQPQAQSRDMRNSADFIQRANASQQLTQSYAINNFNQRALPRNQLVREGVSRPLWLDGKLLLARRTISDDRILIQGCWFNWEKIRDALTSQIADLLPNARLVPYQGEASQNSGRVLATLPIALDVSQVQLASATSDNLVASNNANRFSPIRVSLLVAWSCLLLGAVAVAMLLQGVVKLSERRASFVSAVTHELRTPLTTFRMYAEMLARGMVKSPEKQQQYCETLQVEADRLSHMVENVLQFARLEHGKTQTAFEALKATELLDRFELRFRERVEQAGMQLDVRLAESKDDCEFRSDPAAIEHILFNLIDNACKYAQSAKDKTITLGFERQESHINFRVTDRGPGIARDQARRIFRPFAKSAKDAANSAPGVGLGLSLCQRLAKQLGGRLTMSSNESVDSAGTQFTLALPLRSRG